MSKKSKLLCAIAGSALAAAAVTAYLIAPEKTDEEKKSAFFGRNIAHRGLHTPDGSVPENSLEAFRLAVEAGYGIELDVHLTVDDRVVVFHDDTLERMCGCSFAIDELTYDELKKLRLGDTDAQIPLLSEVLGMVSGRVPIVLEIKRGAVGRNQILCERTYELLRCYNGDVCIESFDPLIMRWWKKNVPGMMRGQLTPTYSESKKFINRVGAFILSNVMTNFLSRPHFIACGLDGKKPPLVKVCEKMGAMKVAWTSHDWSNEIDNDVVIFEHYRPRAKFK